jgi:hypothetical protein
MRNINRLEEGDVLLYRPILRSGEQRKGEVALVLVPVRKSPEDDKVVILDPKPADQPQSWTVPMRTAVVAYVYGPAGLNRKKVKDFLSRDEELIAQLADYAEKTAQTEALIAALSSPNSSGANVDAALQGFSSKYGMSQIDRTAPTDQQALVLMRALTPAMATYDPITPQPSQGVGQTAGLATAVAALFFGSPVGLAAGGTAMLLQLHSIAFPNAEFRSSFAQPMPEDGLGLCGRRDPSPPHTKVAYVWASRVPNVGPPLLAIDKENSIPAAMKSPVPVTAGDPDWKYVQRAHGWALLPDEGKPIPIKVEKLGGVKALEIELGPSVKAGRYRLIANWDWDRFSVAGHIDVRPLNDFKAVRLLAESQDLLVARTGKVPVTLQDADFEFVTKVAIEKAGDKFASPLPVPFVLPQGVRQGPQDRMDVQVNTTELEAGDYKLLIDQLDGKEHSVNVKILPAPPQISNLPMVLNQGSTGGVFWLRGQRLDELSRVEIANGAAELSPAKPGQTERKLKLRMASNIAAGTSLAVKAYMQDRSEPLTFADAVRIVGPRPQITELMLSFPPRQNVHLEKGELPGGVLMSAMLRAKQIQSNSVVKLACAEPGATVTLHLGERSGPISLQQLAPDQLFLSFDTSAWLQGCDLNATIVNGSEGESDPYLMGRIVRVPKIDKLEVTVPDPSKAECDVELTGENLETIEKAGWSTDLPLLVIDLPLPVPNDGAKQSLHLHLPSPGADAQFYIWLRGEANPRGTKILDVPAADHANSHR